MHNPYSSPTDTAGGAIASRSAKSAIVKLRVKDSASLVIRMQPAARHDAPRTGTSKQASLLIQLAFRLAQRLRRRDRARGARPPGSTDTRAASRDSAGPPCAH